MIKITFLFLGIDGTDYEFLQEFGIDYNDNEDVPLEFSELDQDMRKTMSPRGVRTWNTGWWTFYLWGAIASGQVLTPEMRQEHPLPDEVEWPLKPKYVKQFPKSFIRYLKGRVKRRPKYDSFAWDSFENVKVINWPITMPEYCENCRLFRDDAISRDYNRLELDLLAAEINDAINKDYDAVFAATRAVDTACHGATFPANFDEEDQDAWLQESIGKSFEEYHENGMNVDRFMEEGGVDVSEDQAADKEALVNQVFNRVEEVYTDLDNFLKTLNWEGVDGHVAVSDHGFNRLGAGSVNSHSRHAVLSSSLGDWRYMSGFITEWRTELEDFIEDSEGGDFEGVSQEEEVKQRMEDLGYL